MNVKLRDAVLSEAEKIVLMTFAEEAGRHFVNAVMGQEDLKGEELEGQRALSSFVRGIAKNEWNISNLSEGERMAIGLLLEKIGL